MIYDNQNSNSQMKMSSPVLSLLLCLLLPNLLLAKTCCDEPQVRHLPMNYDDTVLVVVVAGFGSKLFQPGSLTVRKWTENGWMLSL